jgi:hypothetical protein
MLIEEFTSAGPRAIKTSESYLRRLLPLEYKYTSKARLDYQAKHKGRRGRKKRKYVRLKKNGQQQFDDVIVQQATVYEQQEPENLQQPKTIIKQQREEVKALREDLARLKDQEEDVWIANGTIQLGEIKILLIITVDSKQRKIVDIELDFSNCSIDNEGVNNVVE